MSKKKQNVRNSRYRPTIPDEILPALAQAAVLRTPIMTGNLPVLLYLITSDKRVRDLVEYGRTVELSRGEYGRTVELSRGDMRALFDQIADVMDGGLVKDARR